MSARPPVLSETTAGFPIAWKRRFFSATCGLAAVLLMSLTSCQTTAKTGPPGSRLATTARQAPFYKYGPAQSFGPDYSLPKGTRVTLVQNTPGYCKVLLPDGTTGFVSSEDVAAAPADPASAKIKGEARNLTAMYSGKIRQSKVAPTPDMPLFDVNDVPLPSPGEKVAPAPGKGVDPAGQKTGSAPKVITNGTELPTDQSAIDSTPAAPKFRY